MGDIISSSKVLDKRTVNYVSGGPYTLIIYNSKTKEIEHIFEDEDGLTEFAIEGTDRAIEYSDKKADVHSFIAASKLTLSKDSAEAIEKEITK